MSASGPIRRSEGTVLLVHGDTRLCELVQLTLGGAGYDVLLAGDSDEALGRKRRGNPDLILLDASLAASAGEEFCAHLRGALPGSRTPLITLSEHAAPEAARESLAIGAEDFLARPFSPPEILLRVRRVLERGKDQRALAAANERLDRQLQQYQQDVEDARRRLREQLAGMQAVVDFSQVQDPLADPGDLGRRCLLRLAAHLRVTGVCLFERPRAEAAWVVPAHWHGVRETRVKGLRLPLGGEFLRILAGAGRPLRLEEFETIPGTAWEAGILAAAGFTLAAPLLVRQELTGVLALTDGEGDGRVDAAGIEQLALFAAAAAQMLETARVRRREHDLAEGSLGVLVDRLESAHPFLAGHTRRVVRVAVALGHRIGLGAADRDDLAAAAWLHDTGLVDQDAAMLARPGPLTGDEWTEVRRHPARGAHLAAEAGWSASVSRAILHHHERWDGGGYPAGLRADAIPVAARIIALAESYIAMLSARPWRGPLSEAEVLENLRLEAGARFDPALVDHLTEILTRDIPLSATGT